MKQIKKRIQEDETLLGCWLNLGSPITAEIVGRTGYDWVLIDYEHGAGSEKDVLHQLQALEHTPAAAFVRVESYARQRFHRVLDMGAEGIMCPRITTISEAQQAADAMHYQPEGSRGVAMMVRATGYGAHFEEYFTTSSSQLVGIVQIETTQILDSLDEVARIEGIDVLFVGPLDLSIALGVRGHLDHPRFQEAIQATVTAARNAGKAAGILIREPDQFHMYHDLGYRFIACGSDSGFVRSGAENICREIRKSL